MKKYYFIFGVMGLLIGYFSKTDFWFEDGRDIFFPISKAQLKKKKTAPPAPDAAVSEVITQNNSGPTVAGPAQIVALENLSQFELFHQLYNSKVLLPRGNHSV